MESAQGFRLNEIVANYRQRVELPSYILAVDWFQQAFRALAGIHATGRVHRSIGLDKIFVGADDEVRLEDVAPLASLGGNLPSGDPDECAAPEQRAGRAVDARGDIYSLGAAFYILLTNRRPGSFPDRPSSINATVPPGFDEIVLRTLATAPEDRYPSADAVLADLAEMRRGPGSRNLPGLMPMPAGPVRPAGVPLYAMVAAGAILGAAGGLVAAWLLHAFLPATVLVGVVVGGGIGAFANPQV